MDSFLRIILIASAVRYGLALLLGVTCGVAFYGEAAAGGGLDTKALTAGAVVGALVFTAVVNFTRIGGRRTPRPPQAPRHQERQRR